MGRIDIPDKPTGSVTVTVEYLQELHDTIEDLHRLLVQSMPASEVIVRRVRELQR
jgi:hypothetical protein